MNNLLFFISKIITSILLVSFRYTFFGFLYYYNPLIYKLLLGTSNSNTRDLKINFILYLSFVLVIKKCFYIVYFPPKHT